MQPSVTSLRRWELIALVGILLLAALLRLGAPGITEFKRDEANLSQLALDLARGRQFPWLGIDSSVGVPNPPLNVYLFAIPYLLDDTPVLPTLFVGVLNVIAVALTWWLARRYYGPVAAVVAGVLYAASPWGALYSRKIWAQDLLPPFIVATVFTGLLGYGEGKRWARWAHWPLLAITVQLHYGAFTLIPLSVLIVGLWSRRAIWRDTIIGLGLAALTVLPILIGLHRADLLSLDTIRDGLESDPGHEKTISTTALDYAWFTVAGKDIHSLAGPEQFENYLDSVPDVYWLFNLIPLGTVLAAGWLAYRAFRERRARTSPGVMLIGWLVLPVLAFTWEWTEVAPHYMIPLMPPAYILCGAGFAALWQKMPTLNARAVWVGGGALVAVIVGLQVVLFTQLLHFLDTHYTPGGFGTPLHVLLDVRETILDRHPDDVIVISEGQTAPYDEEPAIWGVLLDPVPSVRFVNGTQTAVDSAGESLELIAVSPGGENPPFKTCAQPDCLGQEDKSQVFEGRPGGGHYVVRPEQMGVWADDMIPLDPPVRFANGAMLTGYAVQGNAVVLAWELGGPVQEDYQAFAHAYDTNGGRPEPQPQDRQSWPGCYWRTGDTLYLWFDVTLPPEIVSLYAGMYTLTYSADGPQYHSVRVLDVDAPPDDYMAHYGATIALER